MSAIVKEGAKVYIEGVRMVSWDTGEMCEFASALVSAMDCLGKSVPYHDMQRESMHSSLPDTRAPTADAANSRRARQCFRKMQWHCPQVP